MMLGECMLGRWQRIVPGGHVGLFMGARTLEEAGPEIAAWIARQG
jgi:hypothetical protein